MLRKGLRAMFSIRLLYGLLGKNVFYTFNGETYFIKPGEYQNDTLTITYDYGSEKFKQYTAPATVDAYGEKAHLLSYKIDLVDPNFGSKSSMHGKIVALAYTGVDWDKFEQYGGEAIIYFMVDGDYIAFSAESLDDAERILYGEFGYFWRVTVPEFINDLFDGCDDDETMDDY